MLSSHSEIRREVVRVFVVCWLAYVVSWAPYIIREHYPAASAAESGTLNVARYIRWSDDIFAVRPGVAFINNNPGASLTAAIPLILLRPVLERVDSWNQRQPAPPAGEPREGESFRIAVSQRRGCYFLLIGFLTTALVMAPATAGMLAYLCSRLIAGGVSAPAASFMAIVCGLATPLLFRAGLLNHNLLVADAGFIALLVLWDPSDRALTLSRVLTAGLLCGYALLCDYSGAVVVAVAALYVWQRADGASSRLRSLAMFAAGVVPGIAILFACQAWAFGSFYHPAQYYMTPTAPTAHGYRGFDWPSPALAWALLADPRFGIFAYAPGLILAFAAPFVKRARPRIPRRESRLVLTYFATFLLFCSANRYAWLQPLTGFRYLVPVVPGMALLAMETAAALPALVRWSLAGLSAIQMALMTWPHENDVRRTLDVLFARRFAPAWLTWMREAGAPLPWIHAAEGLAAAALGVVLLEIFLLLRKYRRKLTPQPN
ncbi:MAG TPA: hypothetical protein VG297_25610 [Bryobacteraceae bacterium]|nr:hypothetical protein [Bryobacteraceae bacterium]